MKTKNLLKPIGMPFLSGKPVPPEIEKNLYHNLYAGLAGMTPQSLDAYAQGFMKKARYRPDEPDLWRSLLPAYGRSDFLFRS